jgi:hypothetical protein
MKYIVRYENFNESKGISDSCEKITNSIWNDIENDIINTDNISKKFTFSEDDFKLKDIHIDFTFNEDELGYKAAQSNSKQFSLEDIKTVIKWLNKNYSSVEDELFKPYVGREDEVPDNFFNDVYEETLNRGIQSLSTQQLPSEFIPEYIWEWFNNVNNTGWENISPSDMDAIIAHGLKPQPEFRKRLKTITNSEGKQELVGTWKY